MTAVSQPSGEVTLVFSDIEGSTKLLEELGTDAYREALQEHRRIVRESCGKYAGYEVDYEGDAFFYAFSSASEAVAAVSEAMAGLKDGPIAIRVGMHTGTPGLDPPKYVGMDVHFAARIMSSAHGGQVVLSQATADLVADDLHELGEHRLKDIPEAIPLFQLGEGSFPPLKTISNTNLPRPASSFLGREAELQEVIGRVEQGARLLTLTGPGGTGKTRLALEAASSLVESYKAGVFWVGLASLRDPALVTETIAQTLGAKDGLAEHVGEREMLLLLDNLEQVVDAAPELVMLLNSSPNLALLVTSRELLHVQGEVEYPVPPLAQAEAVSLFCERAQTEASEEISELCRRLDSLPLAVELAAARTKALSPAQILERLSQRLDLLKGGRDADPRQQTLRAAIEWSYDLLSEEEQWLFRALSVFAGGCTLEAAEEVVDADLDTLQSLVEKSLIRFSNERYWMLETIRQYSSELFEQSEEAPDIRQRHADHVLAFAARARTGLSGHAARSWLDELEQEQDNLRATLVWLEETGQADARLDLVGHVWNFWRIRGAWLEGRKSVEGALAGSGGRRTWSHAEALHAAMAFAGVAGDLDSARTFGHESLSLFRELDDAQGMAFALEGLGVTAIEREDYSTATRMLKEAMVRAVEANDLSIQAHAIANLAELVQRQGDYGRAITLTNEALAIYTRLGDDEGICWTLCNLAFCLYRTGRTSEAASAANESLRVALTIRDPQVFAWNFTLLGAIAAGRGQTRVALKLIVVVEALLERTNDLLSGAEAELHAKTAEEVRQALGAEHYAAALAVGQAMSVDHAVEFARENIR